MKRGLIVSLLVVLYSLLSLTLASAQSNIVSLAQNDWFNAILLFFLIFAIFWFILQQIFNLNKPVTLIISFVLGIIGAFGIVAYYGSVVSKFGDWFFYAIILVVILVLYFELKDQEIDVLFLFSGLALIWLFYGRYQLCGDIFFLTANVCTVLFVVALLILAVSLVKFIIWIVKVIKRRKKKRELEAMKKPVIQKPKKTERLVKRVKLTKTKKLNK